MIKRQLLIIKNSSLARNAGWMFAGQGLSFVVQGLYFVVLARVLGSLQYGVLAGAAALVTVVSQYSTMGSGLLFLRYVSPDHTRFREYWGNILLSTAVFGTALVLGVRLVSRWMIGPDSASIIVVLAVGDCMCGQLTAAAGQVFQTFEKMRITATLNLMTNLLRLLLAAGMFFFLHHATAWQWAMASLLVSLAAVLTAFVTVTVTFGWPIFRPALLFRRVGEGSIFAVSGSTTSVYNDVDKVMLGHYGMTVANGIYTMAYRVVNIAAMPIMSIQAAAFPRFFRAGVGGATATEPLARKILKRTALLGVLSAAGMFLLAGIIPYLVGAAFTDSVRALRWLCLIPLFRSFHVGAGDAMAGAGYQRFRLGGQAIAAGSNFAMNLYLIPRYSWFGATLASLLTDGSLGLMSWALLFWLKRREGRFPVVVPEAAAPASATTIGLTDTEVAVDWANDGTRERAEVLE